MEYSIYNGKTKKGSSFKALKIKIGEYETLLFPTKIEMIYLENLIKEQAHAEFQNGLEDDR